MKKWLIFVVSVVFVWNSSTCSQKLSELDALIAEMEKTTPWAKEHGKIPTFTASELEAEIEKLFAEKIPEPKSGKTPIKTTKLTSEHEAEIEELIALMKGNINDQLRTLGSNFVGLASVL